MAISILPYPKLVMGVVNHPTFIASRNEYRWKRKKDILRSSSLESLPLGVTPNENMDVEKPRPLPTLIDGHDDHDVHFLQCQKFEHHVVLQVDDHIY